MQTTRTHTRSIWLFIGAYLCAGIFNLLTKTRITLIDSLMFCLNFSMYAGMILIWAQSVYKRLLPSRARSYIVVSAALMLGALVFRTFKYRILTGEIAVSRYTTYAYWIYTLLIPTLFLMTALRLQKGEGRDTHPQELWLILPAVALCVLALSNDLHGLVYQPSVNLTSFDIKAGMYIRGPGFFILNLWMGLMALCGIALLLRLTRQKANTVMSSILVVLGLWAGLELLNIVVLEANRLPQMYNTPEIRVFAMLAIFEICIASRLIPHNENQLRFFERLSFPVLITDKNLRAVHRSALNIDASPEELRAALKKPCYISEDILLSGMELEAGCVFWTTDESDLHRESRRLASANELLSEENDLIRIERELQEKKLRLDVQADVYRQIAAVIHQKQEAIRQLLEQVARGEASLSEVLGRICVLNAYSKRKSNLLLLSQTELPARNRELFLALQETARYLDCCGIEAAATGEQYSGIPLPLVHKLYDSFEAIVEVYLPSLKRMTVSLSTEGVRVALEADEELALPATALPVVRCFEDGITYLSISYAAEGDAA